MVEKEHLNAGETPIWRPRAQMEKKCCGNVSTITNFRVVILEILDFCSAGLPGRREIIKVGGGSRPPPTPFPNVQTAWPRPDPQNPPRLHHNIE